MSKPSEDRRASLLLNVGAYFAFGVALLLVLVAGIVGSSRRVLHPVKALLRFMFRILGVRVEVVGLDRVDWSRPWFLMSNHVSMVDHFVTMAHLPGHLVGVEKKENFSIPLYGRAAKAWGQISIERGNVASVESAASEISERMQQGRSVLVYPEGTRSSDGRLGPFKKGVFYMAHKAETDVLPVMLEGLHALAPGRSKLVRSGRVRIHIGEPVSSRDVSLMEAQVRMSMLEVLEEAPARSIR